MCFAAHRETSLRPPRPCFWVAFTVGVLHGKWSKRTDPFLTLRLLVVDYWLYVSGGREKLNIGRPALATISNLYSMS